MNTTREGTIGEQLVAAFLFIDEHDRSYRALAVAIDAALQQREQEVRERAARIAETVHDEKVFDVDLILRNEIAAAIRRDGTPQGANTTSEDSNAN